MNKKLSIAMIYIGVFLSTLALLVDFVRNVNFHLGWWQINIIVFGILVSFLGALILLKPTYPSALKKIIIEAPMSIWVLSSFILVYIALFFRYTFLSANLMQISQTFVPYMETTIGVDLSITLEAVRIWFTDQVSPYTILDYYTPFSLFLFSPLFLIPFQKAYTLMSFLTVFAFIFNSLILLNTSNPKEKINHFVYSIFLITGIFSYGFLFEIERGQFNLIAIFFSFLAIYIIKKYPQRSFWAIFLFTISVQLKLYPAVFFVLFIEWKEWKVNIYRFGTLIVMNLASFLIFGPEVFFEWFNKIAFHGLHPYSWEGNHSIYSFINYFVPTNRSFWGIFFLVYFGLCFFVIFLKTKRLNDLDPYLLLGCTILALVLPSVSHDYTLPLLVAPTTLLVTKIINHHTNGIEKVYEIFFLFLYLTLFHWTLFSFVYKPAGALTNNFLPLCLMMFMVVVLTFFAPKNEAL